MVVCPCLGQRKVVQNECEFLDPQLKAFLFEMVFLLAASGFFISLGNFYRHQELLEWAIL